MCDITIMKEPRNPYFMLLGDSFLRAYFTVYKVDERQIGLLSVDEEVKPRRSSRRRKRRNSQRLSEKKPPENSGGFCLSTKLS